MLLRPATRADLPVLLEFEQGVVLSERPFNPTLKPDPISYYDIGALIDADTAEVVVVVDGETIVASGYAREKPTVAYVEPDAYCYLGFMYVRPAYRGKGINKMVVDYLLAWGRARGLTEARLEVYSENVGAIRAYEKAGFAGLMLEMRLEM